MFILFIIVTSMALSLTNSLKRHWEDDEGNYKRKFSRHSYTNEIQTISFTKSSDNKLDGYNQLAFLTEANNSSEFCNNSPHQNTQLPQTQSPQSVDKHDVHFMDQDLHENTSNMSSLQKVDVQNDKSSLPQCPQCASGKPGHIQHMKHWQVMDYL